MINKLAIGTVQFGLDYGINNDQGKVDKNDVISIIDLAREHGVDTVDTARAYGESESVLGTVGVKDFKVISKLPPCSSYEVESLFEKSLENLKVEQVYGYMIHNFDVYKKDKNIWKVLASLKKQGKIEKVGISLYTVQELDEILLREEELDIVQIPFSVLDQRFDTHFKRLKEREIEVHTRSAFLQGLVFMSTDKLPSYIDSAKASLNNFHSIRKIHSLSIQEFCLGFCLSNKYIDRVVVGVDNLEQFKANVDLIVGSHFDFESIDFQALSIADKSIINPSLWKKEI